MTPLNITVVECIGRCDVKGQSNDDVEPKQHGALEVVGLAVLDGVRDDEHRYCEGDRLN